MYCTYCIVCLMENWLIHWIQEERFEKPDCPSKILAWRGKRFLRQKSCIQKYLWQKICDLEFLYQKCVFLDSEKCSLLCLRMGASFISEGLVIWWGLISTLQGWSQKHLWLISMISRKPGKMWNYNVIIVYWEYSRHGRQLDEGGAAMKTLELAHLSLFSFQFLGLDFFLSDSYCFHYFFQFLSCYLFFSSRVQHSLFLPL